MEEIEQEVFPDARPRGEVVVPDQAGADLEMSVEEIAELRAECDRYRAALELTKGRLIRHVMEKRPKLSEIIDGLDEALR